MAIGKIGSSAAKAMSKAVAKKQKGYAKRSKNKASKDRAARNALKKQKDMERKQARAEARNRSAAAKKPMSTTSDKPKSMVGGKPIVVRNKPSSPASPRMKRASTSRTEKEVKGETIYPTKPKLADSSNRKAQRKGLSKKAITGGVAASTGLALVADSQKPSKTSSKKVDTSYSKGGMPKSTYKSSTATKKAAPKASKNAPKSKADTSEFGKAFAAARKSGKATFDYKGKKYHTRTKEDEKKASTGNVKGVNLPDDPRERHKVMQSITKKYKGKK